MNGILFKPDMIQAIVEGRKTQTRRVIKPQPPDKFSIPYTPPTNKDVVMWCENKAGDFPMWNYYSKPRYHIGQTLYIKEAWATMAIFDHLSPKELKVGSPIWFNNTDQDAPTGCGDDKGKPRSPMFLMEWMARYFIQITNVEPQRLQEITSADVEKEGTPANPLGLMSYRNDSYQRIRDYEFLWESINRKIGWASNTWVWKYTFKQVKECH